MAQILHDIYHTHMLKYSKETKGRRMGAKLQEWCEFHRTYGHSMEDCRTLQEQIERLIQEGQLGQYPATMLNTRRRGGREANHPRGGTLGIGGASVVGTDESRKRKASNVLTIRRKANITPTPVITFSERDMRYEPPRHDEPMVISVVTVNYKIERGSSANILYWLTCKKLGLQPADLEACARKLYGFVGEQVTIKGVIELETTFRERTHAHTIPVLYTVVEVDASYNIIMGRPTFNKLGAMVSTLHLCMKYPVVQEVGRVWADHRVARRCYKDSLRIGSQPSQAKEPDMNVLDLDLDPKCEDECERPLPAKDLRSWPKGSLPSMKTKDLRSRSKRSLLGMKTKDLRSRPIGPSQARRPKT
ncbi:hypothetical protein CR513_43772, partial [Mucuna pruriens]